ncbi:hypothetical protein ACIRQY_33880 [Streptomyces sp. NPDC101490]|uniref:hypothetical protein n=1 Tax=Streptomyces sp. NPDC101490 TaxID=3366143 RepID=UPI0038233CDE
MTLPANWSGRVRRPNEWMPLTASAQCPYLTGWVSVELRWKPAADQKEATTLTTTCPTTTVSFNPAP